MVNPDCRILRTLQTIIIMVIEIAGMTRKEY